MAAPQKWHGDNLSRAVAQCEINTTWLKKKLVLARIVQADDPSNRLIQNLRKQGDNP